MLSPVSIFQENGRGRRSSTNWFLELGMQSSADLRRWKILPLPSNVVLSLFCIGFGGGAIWIAFDYPYGTLTSMGPGFVPTAVAGILAFLGVLIGLGREKDEPEETSEAAGETPERETARPLSIAGLLGTGRVMLFILGGILVFGSIIRSVGLAISVFALVVLVTYARQHVRLLPTLAFGAAVTIVTCIVFVTLLGLETPVLPRF
jgi:hypothetical protein